MPRPFWRTWTKKRQKRQPSSAAVSSASKWRKVSIVEMSDQVMAPLDKEMAEYVHEELKKKDIELILGDGVDSFTDDKGKTQITTQSGRTLVADLVLLSIGVRPNSQLAKEAGL